LVNKKGIEIQKNSIIDATISKKKTAISFFVTRFENRIINGVNHSFVAGTYIAQ
jgi:hypothetical protein